MLSITVLDITLCAASIADTLGLTCINTHSFITFLPPDTMTWVRRKGILSLKTRSGIFFAGKLKKMSDPVCTTASMCVFVCVCTWMDSFMWTLKEISTLSHSLFFLTSLCPSQHAALTNHPFSFSFFPFLFLQRHSPDGPLNFLKRVFKYLLTRLLAIWPLSLCAVMSLTSVRSFWNIISRCLFAKSSTFWLNQPCFDNLTF